MRRCFVGINASDINYTAGRYSGSPAEAAAKLPFDAGFESVGVVAAVGPGVADLKPGDAVATLADGFSEFGLVAARMAIRVRRLMFFLSQVPLVIFCTETLCHCVAMASELTA